MYHSMNGGTLTVTMVPYHSVLVRRSRHSVLYIFGSRIRIMGKTFVRSLDRWRCWNENSARRRYTVSQTESQETVKEDLTILTLAITKTTIKMRFATTTLVVVLSASMMMIGVQGLAGLEIPSGSSSHPTATTSRLDRRAVLTGLVTAAAATAVTWSWQAPVHAATTVPSSSLAVAAEDGSLQDVYFGVGCLYVCLFVRFSFIRVYWLCLRYTQ